LGVDKIYLHVFLRSIADIDTHDTNVFDLLRLVVGSILLVFDPLSCADLAKYLVYHRGESRVPSVRSTLSL
jgi:hypothetical protein